MTSALDSRLVRWAAMVASTVLVLALLLLGYQLGSGNHVTAEILLTSRLLLLVKLLLVVGRGEDDVLVLGLVVGNRDGLLGWRLLLILGSLVASGAVGHGRTVRGRPLLVLDDVASRISGYVVEVDDIVLVDHHVVVVVVVS